MNFLDNHSTALADLSTSLALLEPASAGAVEAAAGFCHSSPLDKEDQQRGSYPSWEDLPANAVMSIVDQVPAQDFKRVRQVCRAWLQVSSCRRLRLTLSCIQHEALWQQEPGWLSRLIAQGRLRVVCLRLLHLPMGQCQGGHELPASLENLVKMVEQAPLQLEQVEVDIHCWSKEGLDTGPPLNPAWSACIARLGTHQTDSDADNNYDRAARRVIASDNCSSRAALPPAASMGPAPGLRRLHLHTLPLQEGYSGSPSSACIHVSVLQQLALHAQQGLTDLSLAVRASSSSAFEAIGGMRRLRSLKLRYEETAGMAEGGSSGGASSGADGTAGLMSPLSALTALERLSVCMDFLIFGNPRRRGSGAWCLQLLPSFPLLTHLDLTLVLQDLIGLLTGGADVPLASAAAGISPRRSTDGCPHDVLSSLADLSTCFPPGSLQQLRVAFLRVRGYRATEPTCGRALAALVRQLCLRPALCQLTLGLCTEDVIADVPQEVWDTILHKQQQQRQQQQVSGTGACLRQGYSAYGGSRVTDRESFETWPSWSSIGLIQGCTCPPSWQPKGFKVSIELSSESGCLSAFNPATTAYSVASFNSTGSMQLPFIRDLARLQQRLDGASEPASSSFEPPGAIGGLPSLSTTFPLESLRVHRRQSPGAVPTYLLPNQHHLVLTAPLVGALAALRSLATLHLEFKIAVQQPWVQQLQSPGSIGSPAGGGGGAGGSCLLLLVCGLPNLISLHLRCYGTHMESLLGPRTSLVASSAWHSRGAPGSMPAGPDARTTYDAGNSSSSSTDITDKGCSSSSSSSTDVTDKGSSSSSSSDITDKGSRGPLGASSSIAWLRFDDEVANAMATAWARHIVELQLLGLDMEGLTQHGVFVIEGLPLLRSLELSRAVPVPTRRQQDGQQMGCTTPSRFSTQWNASPDAPAGESLSVLGRWALGTDLGI